MIGYRSSAALDRLAIDVADVRFRPAAAPAVRLGADADGGREALTAVRLVAGGPWQPTPEMVRGLAVDPGLGIAVVGLILGDRAMIAWGHECLDFAIDASAEAGAIVVELEPGEDDGEGFPGGDDDPDPESEEVEGTQPAESVRLTRALHYHNFAMPPLVALAEIAIADGCRGTRSLALSWDGSAAF